MTISIPNSIVQGSITISCQERSEYFGLVCWTWGRPITGRLAIPNSGSCREGDQAADARLMPESVRALALDGQHLMLGAFVESHRGATQLFSDPGKKGNPFLGRPF